MSWCECDHYIDLESGMNVGRDYSGMDTCNSCGKRISTENFVFLLMKEISFLKDRIRDIERERTDKEMIEEERIQKEQEQLNKLADGSERFGMMDL